MNISLFYGKKVESTEGKTGYVISVKAISGQLICLLCADEDENEFTIDVKNIIKIDHKIIFEDRESAIKNAKTVRLGCAGFDEEGNYLGNVEEFSFKGTKLLKAKIGKKSFSAENLIYGDVILVKRTKKLKFDVTKDGKVLFKKGTVITPKILKMAEENGEYVQTNLKSF